VAVVQFEKVKEIATESNIRKRNCPQMRLFGVRSRNTEKIEKREVLDAEEVADQGNVAVAGLHATTDNRAFCIQLWRC
jgi:hypothetical protein